MNSKNFNHNQLTAITRETGTLAPPKKCVAISRKPPYIVSLVNGCQQRLARKGA